MVDRILLKTFYRTSTYRRAARLLPRWAFNWYAKFDPIRKMNNVCRDRLQSKSPIRGAELNDVIFDEGYRAWAAREDKPEKGHW